jgi:Tol biopolymer transport system component
MFTGDGEVTKLAVSPDGTKLAAYFGGGTNRLKVLNTADFSVLYETDANGTVYGLAFSPDGTMLYVGASTIRAQILNTATWVEVASLHADLPQGGGGGAWKPDGSQLAISHTNENGLTFFDTATWAESALQLPSLMQSINTIPAYSPDGTMLALSYSTTTRVLDTSDYTELASFNPGGQAKNFAWNSTGTKLAIFTRSYWGVRIMDVATWTSDASSVPGTVNITSGAWTADDSALITTSDDVTNPGIRVFDVSDTTAPVEMQNPEAWVGLSSDRVVLTGDITLPSCPVRAYDENGNPLAGATIYALSGESAKIVGSVTTDGAGAGTLLGFNEGPLIAMLADDRAGVEWYDAKPIKVLAAPGSPALFYRATTEALATMSGRVTVSTGGPADEVIIRHWESRELVAKAIPDANGDWSAQVPGGREYDVTYIKAGCAPVVHGPYTVAAA